jgi:plasmid stability protein
MTTGRKTLRVAEDLHRRLKIIATKRGKRLEEEADSVIRRYVIGVENKEVRKGG